jgi:hypothetical protein
MQAVNLYSQFATVRVALRSSRLGCEILFNELAPTILSRPGSEYYICHYFFEAGHLRLTYKVWVGRFTYGKTCLYESGPLILKTPEVSFGCGLP